MSCGIAPEGPRVKVISTELSFFSFCLLCAQRKGRKGHSSWPCSVLVQSFVVAGFLSGFKGALTASASRLCSYPDQSEEILVPFSSCCPKQRQTRSEIKQPKLSLVLRCCLSCSEGVMTVRGAVETGRFKPLLLLPHGRDPWSAIF